MYLFEWHSGKYLLTAAVSAFRKNLCEVLQHFFFSTSITWIKKWRNHEFSPSLIVRVVHFTWRFCFVRGWVKKNETENFKIEKITAIVFIVINIVLVSPHEVSRTLADQLWSYFWIIGPWFEMLVRYMLSKHFHQRLNFKILVAWKNYHQKCIFGKNVQNHCSKQSPNT